jgi:transposase
VARVERRRQWTAEEKAALMAEVAAEGGRVAMVARRHRISPSLLYNWRSAEKSAVAAAQASKVLKFMPLGVFENDAATSLRVSSPAEPHAPEPRGSKAGGIEIALPNGTRIRVDALVNEQALSRVLRAMKGAL